jgi:hyperosmotically inducible protein
MKFQTSSRIIAAGGMAAVIGIGVMIFALRSDPVPSVAQTPPPPAAVAQIPATAPDAAAPIPATTPDAAAQIPAAPAAVAKIPAAPAAVAKIPAAPAAVAHRDSVGTKTADTATASAVEPKLGRSRHEAKADTGVVATSDTVARSGSAPDTGDESAAATVASNVDGVKSADELTPPATSSLPAAEPVVGASTEFAASDSQITTDVKSAIAADSLSKDFNIGVTTIHGVVVLTGNLASQDAIDRVKDVAGKVKDVKSVDTSALILASL